MTKQFIIAIMHYSAAFIISCLLHQLVFLAEAAASAEPGCRSSCGDIEISFPFGMGRNSGGQNCSQDGYYFDVYCNTSFNPPKLYLREPYHFEVVNFSSADFNNSKIRVKNWTRQWASECYGEKFDQTANSSVYLYFDSGPSTLSDANQITTFGCDGLLLPYQNLNGRNNFDACLPYCGSSYRNTSGSCPGRGCCRTSLLKTDYLYASVDLNKIRSGDERFLHNCSFAFVGEAVIGNFNFSLDDLDDPTVFIAHYKRFIDKPLVLDWRIISSTNNNCTNFGTSLCQNNSDCIPFTDMDGPAPGYNCICKQGYAGNPYLSPGCQDINECDVSNPCAKNGFCTNTPGSFNCSCPRGYYGDGQKHGSGCSPLPTSSSKLAVGLGLGAGMGILILLSACFLLCNFYKKRKKQRSKKALLRLRLQQQSILETTQIFTAKELEKATDHFNTSRILGTGGQGTVYKGMLSDGKIIAIKKSNSEDEKDVELFMNEVIILSQINHRNVVKLLGCSIETQVPWLVYEFVSNGTLYEHIHDQNNEFPLTWNLRLKIATEVAGALSYLHSATCHSIYHRDIKSRNILLDEKYVPKVSDFGTSLSIQEDKTHVTTQVIGTYGYIDPQYFQLSQFTEKSDVYSFGVVLVELLTTQRPTRYHAVQEDMGLAARFVLCMEEGNIETILDTHVLEQAAGKKEELVAVAKLAHRCLNLNGKERPTMKEVAITLESIRMSQEPLPVPSTLAETKFKGVHLPKSIFISDDDYTWTSTSNNTNPSSDICPLKIHTV